MNNEIASSVQPGVPASIHTVKMRIALLILALASVIFPAGTVKAMGMFSQGVSLPALAGSIAYLIPVVFAAALAAPFTAQLQPYSRVVDLVAAAVGVLFLVWGVWSLVDAYSTMAQQERALSSLIGGSSAFQAPRVSDFGSFTPSIGAFALLATAVLSMLQARKALEKRA